MFQQTRLYQINLPHFIISFKDKFNQLIIPHLNQLKDYIDNKNNQVTVHPIITGLTLFLILYIVFNILKGLFGKDQNQGKNNKYSINQAQQLSRQLNDLKKQLKGLYTSFNQLSKQFKNKQINQKNESLKKQTPSQGSLQNHSNNSSNDILQLWKKFNPVFNSSIDNNKKLVLYILESQQQVFRQLKKLKKLNRLSSSSGRPSTTRSRTSDKKYLGSEVSTERKSMGTDSLKKENINVSVNVKVNNVNVNVNESNTNDTYIKNENSKNIENQSYNNNNTTTSSSSLSTNNLNQNSNMNKQKQKQNNFSSQLENEKQVINHNNQKIIPTVIKPPVLKNVKPPLPNRILKPPTVLRNNYQSNNLNQQQLLIKRNQENNILIAQNFQRQEQTKVQKEKINSPVPTRIKKVQQKIIQEDINKTEIEIMPQNAIIEQVREKKQQIIRQQKIIQQTQTQNLNLNINNTAETPSFQNQKTQNNQQEQVIPQNIIQPPKFIKKINPPTNKMNSAGRRAPPPPPRK